MSPDDSPGWSNGPLGRVALWCGPLSIGVSAVGILAATLLAPWFSWTGNALSDLGAAGAETALLFNGALVVTGLLGIPFATRLFSVYRNRVRQVAAAVFGVATVALALIGVFPLPSPTHAPVAVAFFLLFTVAIAVDGVGAFRSGHRVDGALSVTLAAVHVVGWLVARGISLDGIALPELVGSVVLWVWVLRRFNELRG